MKLGSIVRKIQSGDKNAFTDLYNQSFRRVYAQAKILCQNDADAEEITQNTYIKVFENIHKLKNPNSFVSWLYRITQNEFLMTNRKNQKEVLADGSGEMFKNMRSNDEATMPEKALLKQQKCESIMEIVGKLPDEQRDVVILHYMNGLKMQETADALGISMDTAKTRLKAARKKVIAMTKELQKKGLPCFAFMPLSYGLPTAMSNIVIPSAVVSSVSSGITGAGIAAVSSSASTIAAGSAVGTAIATKAAAVIVTIAIAGTAATGTAVAVTENNRAAEEAAKQAAIAEQADPPAPTPTPIIEENENKVVVAATPTPQPVATPTPTPTPVVKEEAKPSPTPSASSNSGSNSGSGNSGSSGSGSSSGGGNAGGDTSAPAPEPAPDNSGGGNPGGTDFAYSIPPDVWDIIDKVAEGATDSEGGNAAEDNMQPPPPDPEAINLF